MDTTSFSTVLTLIGLIFLFVYFVRPRLRMTSSELTEANKLKCTVTNKNWFKRRIIDIQCVIVTSDDDTFEDIKTEQLRQNNIMSLRAGQEYSFIPTDNIARHDIRVKFLASNALGIKKFYEYTLKIEQGQVNSSPSKGTHYWFG